MEKLGKQYKSTRVGAHSIALRKSISRGHATGKKLQSVGAGLKKKNRQKVAVTQLEEVAEEVAFTGSNAKHTRAVETEG